MVIPDPTPDEISLYFHIPFCKKKCGYCHFFVVQDQKELHDNLIKGLLFEIDQAKETLNGRTLKSIYFGGGTPSLIDPKNIDKILNKVAQAITIPDPTEISMEFNPESASQEMYRGFKSAGINRASIGIQSFDDTLLKTLTRDHSASKAEQSVYDAFQSGISNITIDLMYEIPNQTRASWQNTLQRATSLPISHLSLYNLTFEEGTAFYRKKNALSLLLPTEEDAKEMLLEAIIHLEEKQFYQYEISAFAKPGSYSCHNTGYWLGREFFGFGPSAFSYLQGKRLRNCENLRKYFELTNLGTLPIDFEEFLPQNDKIRELFTINLRLNSGVHIQDFEQRHGLLPEELKSSIESLLNDELLMRANERVLLTDRGRLFFNEVASQLI